MSMTMNGNDMIMPESTKNAYDIDEFENNEAISHKEFSEKDSFILHECNAMPRGIMIKFNTDTKLFEIYEKIDSSEGGYTFYDHISTSKKCPYCLKEIQ